uniref:gamma-glutamylcyclotransferase-like isoform X2 n=1 Tax=Pristiophorus japonicus TaxID=55135 RepID=UPI00398F2451
MGLSWLVVMCVASSGGVFAIDNTGSSRVAAEDEEFFYLGYGSNMLRERLQLQNPSAVQVSVGCLKGYKLAFGLYKGTENRWGGGVATIILNPEDDVWGVIWRLKAADRQSLDDQEGVKKGVYSPIEVKVEREDTGEEVTCLTYQMNYFNYSLTSPLYKEANKQNFGPPLSCLRCQYAH